MPKRAIGGGTDIIYDDCEGKQISFAEAIYNALYSSVNVSTWLPLPMSEAFKSKQISLAEAIYNTVYSYR